MGSNHQSDARIPLGRVQPRAKVLTTKRLAPVRQAGRRISSELFNRVIAEESERVAHIARVLGVSESLVWAWLDPEAKQQVDLADVVALHLGGANAVAYAYLDEVARWLNRRMAPGRTAVEHSSEIGKAAGAAATALTESSDRNEKLHALRFLKLRADQAMADIEGDEGSK